MSNYNRKILINEDEKVAILSLYGIINEQTTSAIDSSNTPEEVSIKGSDFFGNGLWKSLSPEGQTQLDEQLGKAIGLLSKNKNRVVYVKIIAGESQVTNTDNENPARPKVKPGYLSEKRADTMKSYLEKFFEKALQEKIITTKPIFEAPEIVIGSTKYNSKVDNPNDPKYNKERFVRVELKLKSPEQCIVGLTIEVMYDKTADKKFSCRGLHRCDKAQFIVKLNGVKIGFANLNNEKDGGSRTSGPMVVTEELAKKIIGDKSKDIVVSLKCLSEADCHSSTAEVKISKGDSIIYWDCSPLIQSKGTSGEKVILVLDNCGNLKEKGVEIPNKEPEEDLIKISQESKKPPVLMRFKDQKSVKEVISAYLEKGYIENKPNTDGTYTLLKSMVFNNDKLNKGRKIKFEFS